MACVFGEMRTLKTSERWSPKSVLFGEKEGREKRLPATALRSAWESRHEEFTKVCPRATLRIARTLQGLCWQVLHQDATLSIPRPKKLPLSVSVSA
jgi:hypothetical protein